MLGKKLFHLSVPPRYIHCFFPFYILFTKVKKSKKELGEKEKRRHVKDEKDENRVKVRKHQRMRMI